MFAKEELEKILKLKIRQVNETQLCSLWAGYGSIYALEIIPMATASRSSSIHLICKIIEPPGRTSKVKGKSRGSFESEEHQRKLKSYLVEEEFYRTISPSMRRSGLGLAQYLTSTKHNDGRVKILMEDLRDSHPLSLSSVSLIDQSGQAALNWLAQFHAYHWEQSTLWESWGCGHGRGEVSQEEVRIWPEGCYWRLDTRLEEYNSMTEIRHQRLKRIAIPLAELLRDGVDSSCPHRHRTLIHGDFKIANLLFQRTAAVTDGGLGRGTGTGYHCVSYDFQYLGLGYGVRDLVMLFVSSANLPTSTGEGKKRRSSPAVSSPLASSDLLSVWKEIERMFLEHYHTQLLRSIEENVITGRYPQELTPSMSPGVDTSAASEMTDQRHYPYSLLLFHYELALVDYMRFMAGWGLWGNTNYIEQRTDEILFRLDQGKALQPEDYRTALALEAVSAARQS
jgi:hypothetical protein